MANWWEPVLRGSPALLAVVDAQLTCRDASDAWRARLGVESSHGLSLPVSQLFDTVQGAEIQAQIQAVFAGQATIRSLPVTLVFEHGKQQSVLGAWRVQPAALTSVGAQPSSWVLLSVADADEQLLREFTQLRRRHALILDSAGEGIYGLDHHGNTTFVNKAATEILGWRDKDVIGQSLHDVHHHSYEDGTPYPRQDCPIYAAFKDGKVHRDDSEVFWHSDGSSIPVEYTSTPIREEGALRGAVVVFRDITKRRGLELQREADFQQIKTLKEQLELERDYLRDEIRVTGDYRGIVGESEALKRTLAQIDAVAETPVSVLIQGESGVGKEGIARAIHERSDRANKPLVKVNCASIPSELFESELFGHVKGAFTGAHQDRVGRLQLADGGTLFLDEIGEIPIGLQSKLLRALQEHEFERVGDERTISVDVRFVAATNRDLDVEVKEGRFREDLFYRLSVFPVEVPPLRQRLDDIGPLAQYFLEKACEELRRAPLKLTRRDVEVLKLHGWPGNVRELKNVIERAAILSTGGRLRLEPGAVSAPPTGGVPVDVSAAGEEFITDAAFRQLEKANLLAALRHTNGRISGEDGAAVALGLKPSTLAYRLKTSGIDKANAIR